MFKRIILAVCILTFLVFLLSFGDFNGRITALYIDNVYVRVISFIIAILSGGWLKFEETLNEGLLAKDSNTLEESE